MISIFRSVLALDGSFFGLKMLAIIVVNKLIWLDFSIKYVEVSRLFDRVDDIWYYGAVNNKLSPLYRSCSQLMAGRVEK